MRAIARESQGFVSSNLPGTRSQLVAACRSRLRGTSFRLDFHSRAALFHYPTPDSLFAKYVTRRERVRWNRPYPLIDFISMGISIVARRITTYQFRAKYETLSRITKRWWNRSAGVICARVDTARLFNLLKIICPGNDGKYGE